MRGAAVILGFAAALCLAADAGLAQNQSATAPACSGPEHRQFDFWVGNWTVVATGKDKVVARSRIDRLHDGCVIREQWIPLKGGGGSSLNRFDPDERRWQQVWIDSLNSRVHFEGGLVNGKMVLTGFWKGANGPGADGLVRMTYSRLDDGAVRQFGEISSDHGLSWSPFFDFTYRRSAPPAK